MARGTQLQALVSKLRAEIGQNTNTALGLTELAELQQLLRRHQETLYDEHDWPHLRVRADKVMSAGQRYYDFPATLNLERIQPMAAVLWNGLWSPVHYGIDPTSHYNQHNSDEDERLDPVLRWAIYSPTQFEVWPVSATATTVRFMGTQKLGALTSDSDTADLDDILIVLHAAAEKRAGKADGKAKEALATRRLYRLLGLQEKGGAFRFGEDMQDTPRRPTTIQIAGA
jgi:hypothetical protein